MLVEDSFLPLERIFSSIHMILKSAPSNEVSLLTWGTPLARELEVSVVRAVPFESIETDLRLSDLLSVAAGICGSNGLSFDMALIIGAKSLLVRALEADCDKPLDTLTQLDALINGLKESWFQDPQDLLARLMKVRSKTSKLIRRCAPAPQPLKVL